METADEAAPASEGTAVQAPQAEGKAQQEV